MKFVAMFTVLTFVKVFHWLVQDRVDYIETTPSVSRLSHARILAFMLLLLARAPRPHPAVAVLRVSGRIPDPRPTCSSSCWSHAPTLPRHRKAGCRQGLHASPSRPCNPPERNGGSPHASRLPKSSPGLRPHSVLLRFMPAAHNSTWLHLPAHRP